MKHTIKILLMTANQRGEREEAVIQSIYSVQEGFLEEVMFKVKSVLLRPKEGQEMPTVLHHLILCI